MATRNTRNEQQVDLMGEHTRAEDSVGEMTAMKERLAELEAMVVGMSALGRRSRDQDTHAAEPMHEPMESWEQPALLDHPALRAARPGMVQLWVRTHIRGEPDTGNVFRAFNKGWRPRLPDTLPQELRGVLEVDFNDSPVIGVHGTVLMERPVELHERERRAIRAASRHQIEAIEANLGKVAARGFGRPQFTERKSRAERGVDPAVRRGVPLDQE